MSHVAPSSAIVATPPARLDTGNRGPRSPASIVAALADHARERPSAPALRFKVHGRWSVLSWRALETEVGLLAHALVEAGVRGGQHVLLAGASSARQLAWFLAVHRAGGVALAIDATSSPLSSSPASLASSTSGTGDGRLEATSVASGAVAPVAFAEDRLAVDALERLSQRGIAAPARMVVVEDARGLRITSGGRFRSHDAFRASARSTARGAFDEDRRSSEGRKPERAARQKPDGRALLLPIAWRPGEAAGLVSSWMGEGFELCLPERHGKLEADTRELRPRVLVGTAASYDEVVAGILERLPAPGTMRGRLVEGGLRLGLNRSAHSAARRRLGQTLVVSPLRRVLGLQRTELALVLAGEISDPTRAVLAGLEIRVQGTSGASEGAWSADIPGVRAGGRGGRDLTRATVSAP